MEPLLGKVFSTWAHQELGIFFPPEGLQWSLGFCFVLYCFFFVGSGEGIAIPISDAETETGSAHGGVYVVLSRMEPVSKLWVLTHCIPLLLLHNFR